MPPAPQPPVDGGRATSFIIWLAAFALLFGVFVVAMPIAGALVIAIWIGAYALVFGVTLVALGFRLRSWLRGPHETGSPMPLPAH